MIYDEWEDEQWETLLSEGPNEKIEDLPFGHHVVEDFRPGDLEYERGGLTAHRGILQEGEWVDEERLLELLEEQLGYSREDILWAYSSGKPEGDRLVLRDELDLLFLELSRYGANMTELGRMLGFFVENSRKCPVIIRAIKRARTNQPSDREF